MPNHNSHGLWPSLAANIKSSNPTYLVLSCTAFKKKCFFCLDKLVWDKSQVTLWKIFVIYIQNRRIEYISSTLSKSLLSSILPPRGRISLFPRIKIAFGNRLNSFKDMTKIRCLKGFPLSSFDLLSIYANGLNNVSSFSKGMVFVHVFIKNRVPLTKEISSLFRENISEKRRIPAYEV